MPGMFKRAMLYLGLGSDEDFEAYDQQAADNYERVRPVDPSGHVVQPPAVSPTEPTGPVDPEEAPVRPPASAVRPIPAEEAASRTQRPSVVRTIPAPKTAKPHVIAPVSFNEAQEFADRFKQDQPVIVNLQQADRDLTRRLIDFGAGLCYGVGGSMKKVADAVYMLTPADVEVSDDERARLRDAGLHD